MSRDEITRLLGGWEGYRIGAVERFEAGVKGSTAQVWIELAALRRRRMLCSGCGQAVGKVHDHVQRGIQDLIKHVAAFFGLGWWTVKSIDKQYLREKLGPADLSGVEVVAMDEIAIHKGHRYATVIVEPYTKRGPRAPRHPEDAKASAGILLFLSA